MRLQEIRAKSIITKSGLPGSDYCINPYVGCTHGCIYCYARFMKKFTNHPEPWGEFLDIKINAADLIPNKSTKYKGRSITIGSVTDPYQAHESKYRLMRGILTNLIPLQPSLSILTKSDLVTRDIDLLQQFDQVIVSLSVCTFDEDMARRLEPRAPAPAKRLKALQELHGSNIPTALFISPILPSITDWKQTVDQAKELADEFWFENLNLYWSIKDNIYRFIRAHDPKLTKLYDDIYSPKSTYWHNQEQQIKQYLKQNRLNGHIYFHHKKKTKRGD